MENTPKQQKAPTWERIAIFSLGALFLCVLLGVAILIPEPTDFTYNVVRIILAVAAAGVAALIPGFLEVRHKGAIRAGGALAVFVLVLFVPVATLTSQEPPKPNPVVTSEPEDIANSSSENPERLKIVLMDTYVSENAYDPALVDEKVTNAHWINRRLKTDSVLKRYESDIQIVGLNFLDTNDVMDQNPHLVIVHRSAFDWNDGSSATQEEARLERFLKSMQGTQSYFLIYSRTQNTNSEYVNALEEKTSLPNRISVFQFEPGNPWSDEIQINNFLDKIKEVTASLEP